MKKYLTALLLTIPLWAFAGAEKPNAETIDPRVIHASMEQRRQWVMEQAEGPGAWLFSRDYQWVLAAKSIGPKEAKQLAYLFFYSTGVMGGYFDDPVRDGDIFRLQFHSELGLVKGFPVFVEPSAGLVWQEGQTERIDTFSLIRLFIEQRKEKKKQPKSARTTPELRTDVSAKV